MLHKLLVINLFTFIILGIPLETNADQKKRTNNLLTRFCMARMKSKIDIKNKENFYEISHFTCNCFLKKYNSGSSIKNSRIYCRDKAAEKYTLY